MFGFGDHHKTGSSSIYRGILPLLKMGLVIECFMIITKILLSMAKATTRGKGLMILNNYQKIMKLNTRFSK